VTKSDRTAVLERIKHLEEQLARIPVDSDRHRQCAIAIRMAVNVYLKSLGIELAFAAAAGPVGRHSLSSPHHLGS